jgi:hypothetical protein
MARLDDYNSYLRSWEERKENVGRSFTYWSALYDWVREGHLDLSEFEWEINDYIEWESWARREWIEDLSDEVKAEILDISYLDELVRDKYEQAQEEQQEELFEELDDNWPYKTRDELETEVGRILDDYEYIDKYLLTVCDEYEEDRGIDYDEQLYEELDNFSFVSKSEIVWAIQDYFYPDAWTDWEQPSMWELAEYEQMAEDYIADRDLEFNEEENEETI